MTLRIVSLLPSATEWVFALDLQDDLVGVTFECDYPAGARTGREVVVDGLDTVGLTSGEIDALVRSTAAAGRDLYSLDTETLARLQPDVVLTQDLCRVCALPAGAVDDALRAVGSPARVVTLDPHRLDDVLDGAAAVARACGVPERGTALQAGLRQRLDAVWAAVGRRQGSPDDPGSPDDVGAGRPRVLVLEWTDPPFLAGHWVPDLVTAAGGTPVMAAAGQRSLTTGWDDVAAADIDAVLVAPCGFGLDDAVTQAEGLLAGGRLADDVAVWAIDAGAVVTRPGPRLVDGVEALAAALRTASGLSPRADLSPRPDLIRRIC